MERGTEIREAVRVGVPREIGVLILMIVMIEEGTERRISTKTGIRIGKRKKEIARQRPKREQKEKKKWQHKLWCLRRL